MLEGSVRQGGGRARITAQLIDATSGNHVWAERYDRQLDDEFAVQDEIAQRISSILTERIWQDVAGNIGQKRRQDYNAYDYAFRGVELLHRLEPDSIAQAQDFLQAGIALDPDLFYGHLGLGFCYVMSGFWWGDPDDALLDQAHHHALRLTEIAPERASTYRLLSRIYSAMGKWEEAWDCVQRALRIDPSDGDIIGNRGLYHLFHGEPGEAIEWLDKVLEMHADTPHTADIMRYWKAFALFAATDYPAAVALLRSISGLDFIKAELMAACQVRLGELENAQARAGEVLSAYPAFRLAHVRLWKNFRNEADRQNLLEALREAGLPDCRTDVPVNAAKCNNDRFGEAAPQRSNACLKWSGRMMPVTHDSRMACLGARMRKLRHKALKLSLNCRCNQLLCSCSQQIRQGICNSVSTGKIDNVIRFHGGVSPTVGLVSFNTNQPDTPPTFKSSKHQIQS